MRLQRLQQQAYVSQHTLTAEFRDTTRLQQFQSAGATTLPKELLAAQRYSPFRKGVGGGTDARHARKGGGKAAGPRHVKDGSNGIICVTMPPHAELKILAHTYPA